MNTTKVVRTAVLVKGRRKGATTTLMTHSDRQVEGLARMLDDLFPAVRVRRTATPRAAMVRAS